MSASDGEKDEESKIRIKNAKKHKKTPKNTKQHNKHQNQKKEKTVKQQQKKNKKRPPEGGFQTNCFRAVCIYWGGPGRRKPPRGDAPIVSPSTHV